jgi:hypothetical protein
MSRPRTLHQWVTFVLQIIMLVGFAGAIYEQQWLNAVIVMGIMLLVAAPAALSKRFKVYIPPEFELAAILFIFASLFLGETRGYYTRFWWWDVVLHTSSGFLLGILGFLLVYVLNREPRVPLNMKPGFVALFSFTFALSIGALWEIFEFAMDSFFGMNMQKSGLVDTMWDLIVDTIGAATVAILGYWYMKSGTESFIERWIQKFVEGNPKLFRKHDNHPRI